MAHKKVPLDLLYHPSNVVNGLLKHPVDRVEYILKQIGVGKERLPRRELEWCQSGRRKKYATKLIDVNDRNTDGRERIRKIIELIDWEKWRRKTKF